MISCNRSQLPRQKQQHVLQPALLLLLLSTVIIVFVMVVVDVVDASTQSTIFNSNKAKDPSNLKGINFVSRFMMPYGPNLYGTPPLQTSTDQPYAGYGYGMVSQ